MTSIIVSLCGVISQVGIARDRVSCALYTLANDLFVLLIVCTIVCFDVICVVVVVVLTVLSSNYKL